MIGIGRWQSFVIWPSVFQINRTNRTFFLKKKRGTHIIDNWVDHNRLVWPLSMCKTEPNPYVMENFAGRISRASATAYRSFPECGNSSGLGNGRHATPHYPRGFARASGGAIAPSRKSFYSNSLLHCFCRYDNGVLASHRVSLAVASGQGTWMKKVLDRANFI